MIPKRPASEASLPTDPDLDEADYLLRKADELLNRHHNPTSRQGRQTDDDDIPVLTDIVEEGLPTLSAGSDYSQNRAPASPDQRPRTGPASPAADNAGWLVELQSELEADINREIENWFSRELPALISRELEQLSQHLKTQVLSQARATLLPKLTTRIALKIDNAARNNRTS